ncbi:MAG: hypothetical protein U0V87_05160 [Acidobacteriota bacterium]
MVAHDNQQLAVLFDREAALHVLRRLVLAAMLDGVGDRFVQSDLDLLPHRALLALDELRRSSS